MFRKLIPILLLCTSLSYAGTITRTSATKSTGDSLTATEYNSDMDTVYNEINGNLNSANLATNAVTSDEITADSIIPSKVDEDNTTPFTMKDVTVTAGITASTATVTSTSTLTTAIITTADISTISTSPTFTYGLTASTATIGDITITTVTPTSGVDTIVVSTTISVSTITARGTLSQIVLSTNVALTAGERFYVDGGSDTYFYEAGANEIDIITKGTRRFLVNTDFVMVDNAAFGVNSSSRVYFDASGGSGGDTYMYEATANALQIVTGGSAVFNFNNGGVNESGLALLPTADNSHTLGNASFRWSDMRSVLINGADYGFVNGFILREYPATLEDVQTKDADWMKEHAGQGIQIINADGNMIAVIGYDGNIYANGFKPLSDLSELNTKYKAENSQ